MSVKKGIVLSGGGARGAYQIGVLRAFQEADFLSDIAAYSGASVGSLNATLLASGNIDRAEEIWFSMEKRKLFDEEQSFFKRLFQDGRELVFKGFYKTDKLEKMIEDLIDYNAVYDHDIYVSTSLAGDENVGFFELMSINLRNAFRKDTLSRYQCLKELEQEEIKQTLLASCAIPVVFKPIVINGQTYYDGGVLDNVPVKPLIEAGCKEIFIIDVFRMRRQKTPIPKDVKVHHIKPSKNLRGIMDFSQELIDKRYQIGLEDGRKFVKQYLKNSSES